MAALPDTVTVGNNLHSQRFVPSGFIANSITLLNPNDGIVYVARDRDCLGITVGAWDWKVPSQSYAHLPGPFRSVGLYYLDRSGASLPGEITTYATDVRVNVPAFFAIGRAQVSIVTSLDIGQGAQPQPPAANNVRLWVDPSGNLHLLDSTNQDVKVVDQNDPLGGVLSGFLPNPALAPLPQSVIWATDNLYDIGDPTHRPRILYLSSELRLGNGPASLVSAAGDLISSTGALIAGNGFMFVGSQKDFYLVRDSPSTGRLSGNLGVTGQFSAGSYAPGNIPGSALAAGAATALIGNGALSSSWSTTTVGSWQETDVRANGVVCTGGTQTLILIQTTLQVSVANNFCYIGYGMDGSVSQGLATTHFPAANQIVHISTFLWATPPAGTHRFSLFLNNANAGTLTINNAVSSMISLMEFRH